MADLAHSTSVRQAMRSDSLAFIGIFAVLYVVFLAVALVAQLLMLRWRSWLPGAEQSRTLFGGVRAAVYTLMSHLT
jgi:light-harvesting complex 1 beta chain